MDMEKGRNEGLYGLSENSIKRKNLELWQEINECFVEEILCFKEKFFMHENGIQEIPRCECGSKTKFIDMKRGFREFCSRKCMQSSKSVKEKKMKTCVEKWGVDNPSKSDTIKEKVKKTNLMKFGTEYPLQSESVMERTKKTNIRKWGVDNPSKLKEIRERAEKTNMEKFGHRHAMSNDDIKEKVKQHFINKFGVDNPSRLKEIREKAEKTMLDKFGHRHAMMNEHVMRKARETNIHKYGEVSFTKTEEYRKMMSDMQFEKNSEIVANMGMELINSSTLEYEMICKECSNSFTIQRQLWRNRIKYGQIACTLCNPPHQQISAAEKDLLKYVKDIYHGQIIENYRFENREIDIYLPEERIGIEYNGLYWHSELNRKKDYHIEKYRFFEKMNVSLIQVWEDDWEHRKEIVKSIIANKLGKSMKIFARKCKMAAIDNNEVIRKFLEKNHIQGFVPSKVKIGLFLEDELVSLMTFGSSRKSLGQKREDGKWEMLRFCNKIGTTVIGAASRLLKHFLENYEVSSVFSYSDSSRSGGKLYIKLGFDFVKETVPNYFWCKNGIKTHRFAFRKDKLVKMGADPEKTEVEIMYDWGYFRVFDCGSKKWSYVKN